MMRRNSVLGLASALAALLGPAVVWAANVRGTVDLPGELKTGRRYMGYWRVENGNVPIQPAMGGETVVVLTSAKGQAPAAKTVTVDITGLQAAPSLVVVGEGSVVEFKNGDKVPHDLSTVSHPLMSLERLNPGAVRRQKFPSAGGYLVRCAEYPHVAISVIVVSSPHFSLVDDKGGFKMGDIPEGSATLKIWSGGRWVHERTIDVGVKSADLSIKVAEAENNKGGGE